MKKIFALLSVVVLSAVTLLFAQADAKKVKSDSSLMSESLEAEAKDLDNQIIDYSKKIEDTIKKYKLYNAKDIRLLPYQITFETKEGYVLVRRHMLYKDQSGKKIETSKERSMKITTDGNTVTKFESRIYEKDYNSFRENVVVIIDPSPTGTDKGTIQFSHIVNDRVIIQSKPLSQVKNTTAFPVANNLKRDFYIPHLKYFYDTLLTIGETYQKGIKDDDEMMQDILQKSLKY